MFSDLCEFTPEDFRHSCVCFLLDFLFYIKLCDLDFRHGSKTFFKTEGDEVQLAFTKIELGNYISEQMESVETSEDLDSEIQIFQNALEFSEVKSREVMIPRTEMVAVEKILHYQN